MKFAIIYYSKTGHTREMAEVIARGLAAAGGETRFFSSRRNRVRSGL